MVINLEYISSNNLLHRTYSSNSSELTQNYRRVQIEINTWYQQESEKILLQSRCTDISLNEKVSAYHHDLHKKHLQRSSILKLMTENGLIEGHKKCAEYLEQKVSDLLRTPAPNYESAQNLLLNEVMSCFTVKDNEILLKPLK